MRDIESIVKEVADIYRESGNEAEKYLRKARRLKEQFGPGLAVVYCWFYSVPQKWTQVEPKIFELMKQTNSFDLGTLLITSRKDLARILRPMIFRNQISLQLKNFCKTIREEYSSWDSFAEALSLENIFSIFEKLRKHRNIRITFKNLSAMKIFVGMDDHLLILDTHVAKVLGISKRDQNKYRAQKKLFESLLNFSEKIGEKLKEQGLNRVTMAKWSLAAWFNEAKIPASALLEWRR
jgi:endonuclease III-like uncharacterized protein